jgi:thioredoxin 1
MVNEINTQQFEELLKDSKPVVCDFFATWCGPCKMLSPILDELSESYTQKATFVKIDVDKNIELAAKYGIMSIPMVMIFKNGEVADKSLGFMPKPEAQEFIEKNL